MPAQRTLQPLQQRQRRFVAGGLSLRPSMIRA
jgi:hypothetical protein